MTRNEIVIEELRVQSRIGVPEWERENAQTIHLSLVLRPSSELVGLGDDLEGTIDYKDVCDRVRELAESGERKLIETLAEEVSTLVLVGYPVRSVIVEVRKFILPETKHVAVRIEREA